ncbi:type III PLP-dependent enzyme [Siccirubricoccus sp. G192]|uniref:type III PLP-dependent enzyme n=1 Tax=Siccirubricoccus sp. G192 TaxID=2849651 RepID=UPI001C2C36CC|nr:type III PLP-dependent enzyme [Siccirubricoccus sp. G192]MBV1796347.1 type III PLP-dependent enzyme [Siccirubricoccus sp. G192]
MTQLRSRTAVSPLRRRFDADLRALPVVDDLVAVERPEEPMHCLRPAAIAAAARDFVTGFPGDVLYAVKCNPEPAVLRAVWAGGVRHFDCASAAEVALVRSLFPEAAIHFMHPVKSRGAIREAWQRHGVQDFVLDSADELAKILAETGAGAAEGLGLVVRLALPKGEAVYDLSGKFGAAPEDAAALLRAARPHAARLGLSFHVGSQCLDPLAWRRALALVGEVIRAAGVAVEIVDVGGGFPVAYPEVEPPALGAFFAEIEAGFEALGLPEGTRLWAEPGRALVAGGGSVVVQVQLRRDGALYVNDGVYGALSDAGAPGFSFPVRLIRPEGPAPSGTLRGFELFGPTCDSADRMKGPFLLPEDVREGDWIEIGQLGAYGACLRTGFNGFDRARLVEVRDRPMLEAAAPADLAQAA